MQSPFQEKKVLVDGVPKKIVCHIQSVNFKITTAPPHYHSYIELLYCTAGNFKVYLSDMEYDFTQNDMVLISSGEVHNVIHTDNSPGSYTVIRLEPEILYNSTQNIFETKHLLTFMISNNVSQKVFRSHELKDSGVPYLVKNIMHEFTEREYGYELAMHSDICRLFLWILRYWKANGKSHSTAFSFEETAARLYPAVKYMHANFRDDISAEDMATLCNMSYSYFSRTFKSVFSKGFNDYLNQLRIYESEKLLLTTDMNITEIGMQIGYTSTSYFIHQFKKIKSISPKQYKIQLKK